ncbi:hypothetical protein M422DRAFT_242882 [Sphaerobolus stellatus SS14]|nr:hypothetical protein M422DRAFT_242882 [Sphaerobolus stellatus SS14]
MLLDVLVVGEAFEHGRHEIDIQPRASVCHESRTAEENEKRERNGYGSFVNGDYDDDTHSTSLDDLRTPPQAAPPTSPSSRPSHTVTLPASRASVAGAHPRKSQPQSTHVGAHDPHPPQASLQTLSPASSPICHQQLRYPHASSIACTSSTIPPTCLYPPRSSPTLSLSPHNSNSKRLSFVVYSDLLIDLIFDYNPLRTTLDVGVCASYVIHCIGTNVTTTPSNIFFGLCTFICAIAAFRFKQLRIISDNNMSDEGVMPWRKLMGGFPHVKEQFGYFNEAQKALLVQSTETSSPHAMQTLRGFQIVYAFVSISVALSQTFVIDSDTVLIGCFSNGAQGSCIQEATNFCSDMNALKNLILPNDLVHRCYSQAPVPNTTTLKCKHYLI